MIAAHAQTGCRRGRGQRPPSGAPLWPPRATRWDPAVHGGRAGWAPTAATTAVVHRQHVSAWRLGATASQPDGAPRPCSSRHSAVRHIVRHIAPDPGARGDEDGRVADARPAGSRVLGGRRTVAASQRGVLVGWAAYGRGAAADELRATIEQKARNQCGCQARGGLWQGRELEPPRGATPQVEHDAWQDPRARLHPGSTPQAKETDAHRQRSCR